MAAMRTPNECFENCFFYCGSASFVSSAKYICISMKLLRYVLYINVLRIYENMEQLVCCVLWLCDWKKAPERNPKNLASHFFDTNSSQL